LSAVSPRNRSTNCDAQHRPHVEYAADAGREACHLRRRPAAARQRGARTATARPGEAPHAPPAFRPSTAATGPSAGTRPGAAQPRTGGAAPPATRRPKQYT